MNTKDFDWEEKLRPYIKPFLAAENLLLSMNIRTARVAGWTLNADDVIKADRQQLLKAVEEIQVVEYPNMKKITCEKAFIAGQLNVMVRLQELLKAKDYIQEFDNQIPREGL